MDRLDSRRRPKLYLRPKPRSIPPPRKDGRMASASGRTVSITVAFNPQPLFLARQLEALASQVDESIVVDNGSEPAVAESPALRGLCARVLRLPGNEGIARGFNIGI